MSFDEVRGDPLAGRKKTGVAEMIKQGESAVDYKKVQEKIKAFFTVPVSVNNKLEITAKYNNLTIVMSLIQLIEDLKDA